MKATIVSLVFFLIAASLKAQITLEKTYNYSTAMVKFETLGYKYYLMDVPSAQCRIYNTDHSLYKTINCTVPSGYYLSDVKMLSEKLFNNDPGIELAITFYKYVPTQSSYYYIYGSRIINESGIVLLNIDGAQYIYVNRTGENSYKFFAYCFDYSASPEKVWTNIYGLPGAPVFSASLNDFPEEKNLNAYPNPAGDIVRIACRLPENVNHGMLKLFDNTGKQVDQFIIDNHTDHLEVALNRFSKGLYYYYLEYSGKKSVTEKLLIQ